MVLGLLDARRRKQRKFSELASILRWLLSSCMERIHFPYTATAHTSSNLTDQPFHSQVKYILATF